MTEEQGSAAQKKKKKKRMLIGIIAVTILGAFSWVLTEYPQLFAPRNEDKMASPSSDEGTSFLFHPIDYNLDITKDAVYMDLNRYIYFKNGSETIAITDDDYEKYGKEVEFFGVYFSTIIRGDANAYNAFFTDNYYKTHMPFESFPPQMLYDILIDKTSQVENKDGTVVHTFDVSYKIHKNTGTFRNDIDSDASRVLYFELIEYENGKILIDRIAYYK